MKIRAMLVRFYILEFATWPGGEVTSLWSRKNQWSNPYKDHLLGVRWPPCGEILYGESSPCHQVEGTSQRSPKKRWRNSYRSHWSGGEVTIRWQDFINSKFTPPPPPGDLTGITLALSMVPGWAVAFPPPAPSRAAGPRRPPSRRGRWWGRRRRRSPLRCRRRRPSGIPEGTRQENSQTGLHYIRDLTNIRFGKLSVQMICTYLRQNTYVQNCGKFGELTNLCCSWQTSVKMAEVRQKKDRASSISAIKVLQCDPARILRPPGQIALEYFDDRYWWTSVIFLTNGSAKYRTIRFIQIPNQMVRYLEEHMCSAVPLYKFLWQRYVFWRMRSKSISFDPRVLEAHGQIRQLLSSIMCP